jgi:hypothetical protein
MQRVLHGRGVWFGVLSFLVCAGCRTPTKELESVAKDWCETIRASQVIPVYPLTEDLQPGDVFVVQVPIVEQAKLYREKGFLALDQLATRLPMAATPPRRLGYDRFYGDAFWKSLWSEPAPRPGWTPNELAVNAPSAAFPSYTFTVERGAGIKLALPIHGVPVGLGLMGASRATGSVTIRDVYTYGIDIVSLYDELQKWWKSSPEIASTLAQVVRGSSSDVYLRTVNRVYLTRRVTVSLENLDVQAAALEAGAAPELELIRLSIEDPERAKAAAAAYRGALDAITTRVSSALPGGTIKLSQASQRSVTMDETFDRPLAIGYLGFDVEVGKDGELSAPIPSFAVLTEAKGLPELDLTVAQIDFTLFYGAAMDARNDDAARRQIFETAARKVGGDFERAFRDALTRSDDVARAFVSAKNHYTDVTSGVESERRLSQINAALKAALLGV